MCESTSPDGDGGNNVSSSSSSSKNHLTAFCCCCWLLLLRATDVCPAALNIITTNRGIALCACVCVCVCAVIYDDNKQRHRDKYIRRGLLQQQLNIRGKREGESPIPFHSFPSYLVLCRVDILSTTSYDVPFFIPAAVAAAAAAPAPAVALVSNLNESALLGGSGERRERKRRGKELSNKRLWKSCY